MEFEAEPLEKITLKEIENVVQDIIEKKKNNQIILQNAIFLVFILFLC